MLDALCRIRSYWQPASEGPSPGEGPLAAAIAHRLRDLPWLRVQVEECAPGRPNVFATDGPEDAIELLIIGHLDTVPPTPGWTLPEFSVLDGRYHALGAADTKGGFAALLDAARRAGPTRGVGLLLYADEETAFQGMRAFLDSHPTVRPARVLSVCGPPARMLSGCRGIVELELLLRGRSGHASRPWSGASAIEGLASVQARLAARIPALPTLHPSVVNVAAVRGGSLAEAAGLPAHGPPTMLATANRIPDVAWALIEVRAGGADLTATWLRAEIEAALADFNRAKPFSVELERLSVHFELAGYDSRGASLDPIRRCFHAVHQGAHSDAGSAGYIDIAMLAAERGSGAVCLGPLSGGAHGPDEWVDLASLLAYRDGMEQLLGELARPVLQPPASGAPSGAAKG